MTHRIVVLGGGYAGTSAAARLGNKVNAEDVTITMINADPIFIERVRLHQIAAGQDIKRYALADIVSKHNVDLVVGWVRGIDIEAKTVTVDVDDSHANGRSGNTPKVVEYDTLVYALGSTATINAVPGVAEYADNVSNYDAAVKLREKLSDLADGATVTVVGDGLTGLEAATEIAESYPALKVRNVASGNFTEAFSHKATNYIRKVYTRLGIDIVDNTKVKEVAVDSVTLLGGQVLPTDVTVWQAGFTPSSLVGKIGIELGPTGAAHVNRSMQSVSHPDVYVVGDSAYIIGDCNKALRMSCASGVPAGWQAADAIAARLSGKKVSKIPMRYYQWCVSLGRGDAIIQWANADDSVKDSIMGGKAAVKYKEFICASAVWYLKHAGLFTKPGKARVEEKKLVHS